MLKPLITPWLDARFGQGNRIAWPFPAWRHGDVTWCACLGSELDAMRQANGEEPLRPLVVPVIVIDREPAMPPNGLHIRVDAEGAQVIEANGNRMNVQISIEELNAYNALWDALRRSSRDTTTP